ncbi:Multidrug resistance-associated protein 7, partial [Ophiophagus hannah]
MEEVLADLCGTSSLDPLPLWVHSNVGHCFNQLLLNVAPHVILAVISACYIGTPRSFGSQCAYRLGWKCRIAASFILAGLSILDIIPAILWPQKLDPFCLKVLTSGTAALAWLTHSLALLALYRSPCSFSRGPAVLPILAFFPVPSLIITLVWRCQMELGEQPLQLATALRLTVLCLQLAVLLLCLIGYIIPVGNRQDLFSINDPAQHEPLITASEFSESTWEAVAEDGESWLSRFSYAWMNPLIKRGYQWKLNKPQDVYQLPQRLQASKVCEHFYSCWLKKAALASEDERISSTNHFFAKRDVRHNGLPARPQNAPKPVHLLSVLHAAFGLHYYGLGFLKLAGGLLGFSGPLLLNLLVSFMESHQEPLSHGVLYALGLFASSFLGAILRNQFNYEINKIILTVRTAVISAIYQKALRVNGSSLTSFTTGEIVNFMSTDTDRLVNFCFSFHELWSLPFQFAVTLYLLYQQLMTELLGGMRVIKFYAWEPHFDARVKACRAKELKSLRAIKYLDAVCVYLWAALPVVVSIVIFITYVLLGHQLSATKVFTALALVGMLILPLNNFPWVLNGILEAKVSLDRIQHFLELTDQDLHAYYSRACPLNPSSALEMHNSTFSWSPESKETSESHVPRGGQLFIQNLLVTKESSGSQGEQVYVWDLEKGFGLAAQEPWIQFTSIRENILFGKEYDAQFYQQVIDACALSDDLNILPAGDQTEVGENGVTLSGGQKARIALARAVYQEKELYLLDDPLAAVDTDVANHLMQKCILGILRHKTRILCTHRIEVLGNADMIILMDNGRILRAGTPTNILPLVEAIPKLGAMTKRRKDTNAECNKVEEAEHEEEELAQLSYFPKQEEEKKEGALAFKVYRAYWLAVGSCLALSILLSLLLMQGKLITSPVLSSISSNSTLDVNFYLTVYGCIAGVNSVFTILRAFLFACGTIHAATVIHNRLLRRVMKATMTFFDTTPTGRILNRFSSDLYCVDDSLPFILNIFLANIFGLLGMLVMITYGLPWIGLVLLPLVAVYYSIQLYYRRTSRELKRLYSLTLSPIYTHFSETLTGLSTIRATRVTGRFETENQERLELNQRCRFASNTAMQWLDIRLQMIGVAVVTAIAGIAIIQHQRKLGDPGLVGLALSYALSVTNLLSGLITSFTQTETMMVSVERTEEYATEIPIESQEELLPVSPNWPVRGHMEFQQVILGYRPDLPNALDGVTFTIYPGEKIGIVGRTGSGKSTLFLALFRMVELRDGHILLDNIDHCSVSLKELRSRLAIIPQDPFLFSGTLRENLDPQQQHTDNDLHQVLEQCHLHTLITEMGGLDYELRERGKSLSVGQRQLVCLARALLTQAKILCIDEATASIDQKTDRLIQQTIRQRFADKTVLTIAHRLNTILDSDRVLVMNAGRVAELDSPAILSQKQDSLFQHLLHCG